VDTDVHVAESTATDTIVFAGRGPAGRPYHAEPMPDFRTTPLDADTWPDFARLVEAHNGVWGAC
jgi:hypothetical protein